MKILVINGPNINMLGIRNTKVYGKSDYKALETYIFDYAKLYDINIEILQSNIEGEIISYIHNALGKADGIIINAGAYSHTSIAIMDALEAVNIPCIDVHLSNIHSREDYRNNSYVAKASVGQISGFGFRSYTLAIDALRDIKNAQS